MMDILLAIILVLLAAAGLLTAILVNRILHKCDQITHDLDHLMNISLEKKDEGV